jgi:hypothetical protein
VDGDGEEIAGLLINNKVDLEGVLVWELLLHRSDQSVAAGLHR